MIPLLAVKYNLAYFIFSLFIAFSSSIVCFGMVINILPRTTKLTRFLWLLLASFTLGLGTWTTHFIGIRAMKHLSIMAFNIPILVASLVVIIITSFIGIIILHRSSHSYITAGITFAIGISAMHYLGMYAYHTLFISITDKWFLTGVLLGTLLSCIGCYLFSRANRQEFEYNTAITIGVWIGFSIAAIHYISMNGNEYVITNDSAHVININEIVSFVILSVLLLMVIGILTTYYQQKLFSQNDKLRNQELYYKSLYDLNPDAIIMMDTNGVINKLNEAAEILSGYKISEVLGTSFHRFIYDKDMGYLNRQFQRALDGKVVESEVKMYTRKGELRDIFVKTIPIEVESKVVGVYGVIRDITDFNKNLAALQDAESRYRSIVEESFVGVFVIQNERIIFANAMMGTMFGYHVDELLKLTYWDIIAEEDHDYLRHRISNRIKDNRKFEHYELRGKQKNGDYFYIKAHSSETSYNTEPAIMCSVVDVTEQVTSMEKVEFMAYHDPLTNLPNQRKLVADLTELVENSIPFSLIFLDLNEFKKTNDRYGHLAGDEVLRVVAKRITDTNHGKKAYHIGGDEFVIYYPTIENETVKEAANQIAQRIRQPILYENYELQVYASLGVANYPHDAKTIKDLLRRADLAMYASKEKQGSELVFYQENLLAAVEERFLLEQDLKEALEKKQFELFYQPQVDIHTGKLSGAEALVRWNHPTKGLLPPAQFIHVLEETGLIIDVGEWVIAEVFKAIRQWEDEGLYIPGVSVNISAKHFDKHNLYQAIQDTNKEHQSCLKKLDVEITESAMIDLEKSIDTLQKLKEIGVSISLDDFGTGYSSLSVLHRLPIDCVKIDRSFIKNFDKDSKVVIQMILNLAKNLHVKVIAEGIEKKEQIDFLIKEGCDFGQGYYYSMPLPKREFEEKWLKQSSSGTA
ncbi:EAL domain-containing protein [Fredinandcohnia sp. 179-A 10B2 NHS]|uniref:EAL domain-containing protein n=1 Tax=Fredinandcohnia sp. 179-A 10B2 NHS TaxID=3235176 RepID=UPI0039A0C7B2